MSNVSLDETLFYQYLINHNSTSTMLNALSGRDSEDSAYGSMAGILNTLQSSGTYGTGSISDVATLLGGINGEYSGLSSIGDFSTILQSYLTQDTTEATEMAQKLANVLEETKGTTEENSVTYQTVQELYEYFLEQTASRSASLLGTSGTDVTKAGGQSVSTEYSGLSFDFDSFETETEEMIDSLLENEPME